LFWSRLELDDIHELLDKVDAQAPCMAFVQVCLEIGLGDCGRIKWPSVVAKLDDQTVLPGATGALDGRQVSTFRQAERVRGSFAAVGVFNDVAACLIYGNLHRIDGPWP